MADRNGQPRKRPSPFTGLPAGHTVNFDNHGSIWGTDAPEATEALIAEERAAGATIDEWSVTARDGQPLRIVRLPDPEFLDTICVITSSDRPAVSA